MVTSPFKTNYLEVNFRDNRVFVKWNVVNFKHRYKYSVCRSTDGIKFIVIGTIENKDGLPYLSFIDMKPLESKCYYRITEIQQYGKFHSLVYSNTCAVSPLRMYATEPLNSLMF